MKSKLLLLLLFTLPFLIASYGRTTTPLLSTEETIPKHISQRDTLPVYGPVIDLQEENGGTVSDLPPAYVNVNNPIDLAFRSFTILKEGNTYYMWLGSKVTVGSNNNHTSIVQRFESQDGLTWYNRTDTNLTWINVYAKFGFGLHEVIKMDNSYQGWEQYYYELSSGWGDAIRYVTSNDGINWTVVNQPAHIGVISANVIRDGDTYHIWANPYGDTRYSGTRSMRYRTSTNPGGNWGHWQTGGALVILDSTQEIDTQTSRVRQLTDGTYQLFYWAGNQINVATSIDGINFTTQRENLIDLSQVLPERSDTYLPDFAVINVGGEDWFYFTYCADGAVNFCKDSRIAVSRPMKQAIGTISITNRTEPTGEQDFGFSGDLGEFVLGDNAQYIAENLSPGTYRISEDATTFPDSLWTLLYVQCQINDGPPTYLSVDRTNKLMPAVQIELLASQNVSCIFHNERVNAISTTNIFLPVIFK